MIESFSSSFRRGWFFLSPLSRSDLSARSLPQFFAESAEFLLFGLGQNLHLSKQGVQMFRKDLLYELTSLLGQVEGNKSAVFAPLSPDESPSLQIIDNHRDITAASEKFFPEVTLAEGPEMKQHLQGAELARGEPGGREDRAQAGGERIGGPHQFDEGVEGGDFFSFTAIVCSHGSSGQHFKFESFNVEVFMNINRPVPVVKGGRGF
jgi:hypothetical protein